MHTCFPTITQCKLNMIICSVERKSNKIANLQKHLLIPPNPTRLEQNKQTKQRAKLWRLSLNRFLWYFVVRRLFQNGLVQKQISKSYKRYSFFSYKMAESNCKNSLLNSHRTRDTTSQTCIFVFSFFSSLIFVFVLDKNNSLLLFFDYCLNSYSFWKHTNKIYT